MNIDRDTRLFFDASCLIAAAGSPSGGSGFLLSLCARSFFRGAVSQPVLLEAQKNIQSKLGEEALTRYYRLLVVVPFLLAPVPPENELQLYGRLVTAKDAHVVAATEAINAAFLLTLDKRLALQVNQARMTIQALTPGDFIKSVLINHVDYRPDNQ